MLGLPKGKVFLVPWTEDWDRLFQEEKDKITSALEPLKVKVHHIGSTAVPHLKAKPILDLAIELETFEDGSKCIEPLEKLGYTSHGTNILPERFYFTKGEPRTHQIHMYECGNKFLLEQLFFRNSLRKNNKLRVEYEELKEKLVQINHKNKHQYAEDKTNFIQKVLREAKE